jgi:hypothetical protein
MSFTPHPAAPNAPYVPQGMAGENVLRKLEDNNIREGHDLWQKQRSFLIWKLIVNENYEKDCLVN